MAKRTAKKISAEDMYASYPIRILNWSALFF
jgi:hypothetical protein